MKPKRSASRTVRTVYALVLISALGVGLGVYNAFVARRDAAMATGPQSEAQRRFFIDAAERPDLSVFFKGLSHRQRIQMSQNVGRYADPQLGKLIGICLGDFDAQARAELTKSLSTLAQTHPDAVAEQLKLTGSFQQLGIQRALQTIGPRAVPMVVKQLAVADARNNAVSFLVDVGEPAVPALIATLEDKNVDVRKAAADALGKIGSRKAVDPLSAMYARSKGDEQVAYLAALSAIGDPTSEKMFRENLNNDIYPLPRRALAALGLGRIGSPTAAKDLWRYADHPDLDFRSQIVSALQLAGDESLRSPAANQGEILLIAEHVDTPLAEQLIRTSLRRGLDLQAVHAAAQKPNLVPDLTDALQRSDIDTQGDVIDAAIEALHSTERGRAELDRLSKNSAYAGFIERRTRLLS